MIVYHKTVTPKNFAITGKPTTGKIGKLSGMFLKFDPPLQHS